MEYYDVVLRAAWPGRGKGTASVSREGPEMRPKVFWEACDPGKRTSLGGWHA